MGCIIYSEFRMTQEDFRALKRMQRFIQELIMKKRIPDMKDWG